VIGGGEKTREYRIQAKTHASTKRKKRNQKAASRRTVDPNCSSLRLEEEKEGGAKDARSALDQKGGKHWGKGNPAPGGVWGDLKFVKGSPDCFW